MSLKLRRECIMHARPTESSMIISEMKMIRHADRAAPWGSRVQCKDRSVGSNLEELIFCTQALTHFSSLFSQPGCSGRLVAVRPEQPESRLLGKGKLDHQPLRSF
jgi:hypothetical protein